MQTVAGIGGAATGAVSGRIQLKAMHLHCMGQGLHCLPGCVFIWRSTLCERL